MYGLDQSVNLDFLIGRELLLVCVGKYQVILNFHEDTSITLACDCQVIPPLTDRVPAASLPAVINVLSLLGAKITSAKNIGNGDLALGFSEGVTLMIYDSDEHYESYDITDKNHHIIVLCRTKLTGHALRGGRRGSMSRSDKQSTKEWAVPRSATG
jgi:hypothetical protein